MRKSIQEFIRACQAGLVTESQIRGIRRTISNFKPDAREQSDEDIARKLGNPYTSPVDAVYDAIRDYEPKVTQEQAEKGRQWLLKSTLCKNGAFRKNPYLTDEKSCEIVRQATHARLVGLDNVGIVHDVWIPIYRYETSTLGMEYTATSWQSGITGDRVTAPRIVRPRIVSLQ